MAPSNPALFAGPTVLQLAANVGRTLTRIPLDPRVLMPIDTLRPFSLMRAFSTVGLAMPTFVRPFTTTMPIPSIATISSSLRALAVHATSTDALLPALRLAIVRTKYRRQPSLRPDAPLPALGPASLRRRAPRV